MFKRNCMFLIVVILFIGMVFAGGVFAAEKDVVKSTPLEKDDKDAILEELGVFVDKNPEILRSTIFAMADAYTRDNKADSAIALYEKASKIFPSDEDILSRLGGMYNQKADYLKVAEVYAKLATLKPDNVWYSNMLSEAYINAKQNDKAIAVWEDLMKQSSNADVFQQAANFYSRNNDMEKAIAAIKKAAELKPENTGYLQSLESFYVRAEKFSEAEAICAKAITSSKEPWIKDWANSELINIYQKQDKLGDLAAKFEKDLTANPKDIGQYKRLADLYQRTNERDKAIGAYEKAVSSGIEDRDINNRLLDLYDGSGKLDKAEAQLKKIIAASPNESYLNERLANLLNRAGKKEEAKKAWQDFLAKVQNDAGAFSRYGDRLNEWGDVEGAIAQYRKAQVLDPNNLWYTMRIADLMISKQMLSEAKKELEALISKTKDTWLKQEAQRKINDMTAKKPEATAVSAPLPSGPAAAPKVAGPVSPAVPAPTASVPAKVQKPEKPKAKAWFGR